jgi:hypothetical protein
LVERSGLVRECAAHKRGCTQDDTPAGERLEGDDRDDEHRRQHQRGVAHETSVHRWDRRGPEFGATTDRALARARVRE